MEEQTPTPALAVVLRKAAGHYTAAAAEAAGRGDHALAAEYTARAQQNQAEADSLSPADRAAHEASSYVRTRRAA